MQRSPLSMARPHPCTGSVSGMSITGIRPSQTVDAAVVPRRIMHHTTRTTHHAPRVMHTTPHVAVAAISQYSLQLATALCDFSVSRCIPRHTATHRHSTAQHSTAQQQQQHSNSTPQHTTAHHSIGGPQLTWRLINELKDADDDAELPVCSSNVATHHAHHRFISCHVVEAAYWTRQGRDVFSPCIFVYAIALQRLYEKIRRYVTQCQWFVCVCCCFFVHSMHA